MSGKQLSPFIKISIDRNDMENSAKSIYFKLEDIFRQSSDDVDKIASKLDSVIQYVPSNQDIEELKRKFQNYCASESSNTHYFSREEIMKICCCINSIIDFEHLDHLEERLSKFMYLLKNDWSNRYLCPLALFMLSDWDKMFQNKDFHSFILNEIRKSKSNIRLISTINQFINFFHKDGAKEFVLYLRKNKKNLVDTISMLGLKKENISYVYFRDMMIYYYSEAESIDDAFEEYLELCNSNEIRKIVLAQLIVNIDPKERSAPELWQKQKEKLKKLAIKYIGMPEKDILWNLDTNVPVNAKENVRKARYIVRSWITQQYINVVFNELMHDKRRAVFWSKYAGSIADFKVVGSEKARNIINNHLKDTDIKAHYIFARSRKIKFYRNAPDIYAFIMWIKDRIMIEFSDTGNALYVYNETLWNTLNWKKGDVVADLKMKNWLYQYLINMNVYNDYGRLRHAGNWEDRLKDWLMVRLHV